MDVRELMIGSVVRFYGNNIPLVIKNINSESINAWLKGYVVFDNGDMTAIDCLRPVPLTEEWLLKVGFKNSLNMVFIKNIDEYNQIKILPLTSGGKYNGMYALCNYSDFQVNIKYVHQLQNLYFALTGKELLS